MSGKRQKSKTVTGKAFCYEGDLTFGLIVHPLDKKGQINEKGFTINATIIELVTRKIQASRDIIMGSCRDNPSEDSLGATLQAKKDHRSTCVISFLYCKNRDFVKHTKLAGDIG